MYFYIDYRLHIIIICENTEGIPLDMYVVCVPVDWSNYYYIQFVITIEIHYYIG